MEGKLLKEKLRQTGKTFREIAALAGMSPQLLNQTFNADDVRSGTIEKILQGLGLPMSYLYEPLDGNTAIGNIANAVNGTVTINQAQQALTEQLVIKDNQISRLLGIIEKLSDDDK